MKRSLILALLFMSWATPARAQFGGLEKLADGFSDLGIWAGPFYPRRNEVKADRDGSSWLASYGAEFLFEIRRLPIREPGAAAKDQCTTVATGDPVQRQISLPPGSTDSTVIDTYTLKRDCKVPPVKRFWVLELGVGFGQTSRFAVSESASRMTGFVREAPAISIYASEEEAGCAEDTVPRRVRKCSGIYLGLRTGVTELVKPKLTLEGVAYSDDTPKSVQLGAAVGYGLTLPVVTIFAEASYVYRPFPYIDWLSGTKAEPTVPVRRRLDLSGASLAFGAQVRVRSPAKK